MMIKSVPRYLLVALIILVLLAISYLVIVKRPLLVEVVDVEQGVPVQVFGLGTVEARILSKVGFEVGGMLVELAVDHGERVKQGTVLARLHSAEQQVRVTKAQAKLTQAEAALQKDEAVLVRSRAILEQRQQTNRRQQALVKLLNDLIPAGPHGIEAQGLVARGIGNDISGPIHRIGDVVVHLVEDKRLHDTAAGDTATGMSG